MKSFLLTLSKSWWRTLGINVLGPTNLTVISCLYWFNRCYRCHHMPNQLEAFKMTEPAAINLKKLMIVIIVATLISMPATYWANLDIYYKDSAQAKCRGFKAWVGRESFNRLQTWMQLGERVEFTHVMVMVLGFNFTFLLKALPGAFVWWPFHPTGYALAVNFAMDYFWFAFFISWLSSS